MDNKERTNEEVDHFILDLPNDIQDITESLRDIILNSSKELIEEYKWTMPNYSYKGLVCYLQTAKRHVNLGFQKGNELEAKDDHNLLHGTGKKMRHIRIKKMEDIRPEYFTTLIQAAMALNEE